MIPKISDTRLKQLAKKIRPVVRGSNGTLHYIKPVNLKETAFTWDPDLAEETISPTLIATIRTLHTYGYHGFFKPSIAEVLAQIPLDLLDSVDAFETHGPDTAEDFYQDEETTNAFNSGFHTAKTMLYRSTQPQSRFERI